MAKTAREIALEFLPRDDAVTAELAAEIEKALTAAVVGARAKVARSVRDVLEDCIE